MFGVLQNRRQSVKILAVHTTGERVNTNPVMRTKLEVYPPDDAPYQAVAKDVVPFSHWIYIS